MNQGMFVIWEEARALRQLMQQEPNSLLRTRLHLLYLLRTGVVRTRGQAAHVLGISRNTVGQWLRRYERGGLAAGLALGPVAGRARSLSARVVVGMRAKLAAPRGCASFHELHRWGEQTYQIKTTSRVIGYTATHHLGARLAVARRTHLKKSPMPKHNFAPRSPTVSTKPPSRPRQ